jgi:hypothetical protein
MEAGQVQARRRHERRQPGDEIQRLENYMRRAVTVRGFQRVADLVASAKTGLQGCSIGSDRAGSDGIRRAGAFGQGAGPV